MDTAKQARKVMVRCPFCGKLNRVDAARAKDRPTCGECSKPILLDRPVTVTDSDLDRIVNESDIPIVVDFYADWCGPCKAMAPMFDEAARARTGEVLFTKLDTDRNPAMSARYGIRSIPTLIVFRGGKEIDRQVGSVPKPMLEKLIERAVSGA
jgi:thioredoxin 2